MNIVHVRRVTQAFFGLLFLWFCVVTAIGEHWWQLRGWPVNWLLDLDPLVALGNLLTSHKLYAGLIWSVGTIVMTIFLGRFFCGWVCPFGTLHQVIGWLAGRTGKFADRVAANQYHGAQVIKYYLLIALLSSAAGGLLANCVTLPRRAPAVVIPALIAAAVASAWLANRNRPGRPAFSWPWFLIFGLAWLGAGFFAIPGSLAVSSLQTGLLDPIPLLHRSVNLMLLTPFAGLGAANRFYMASGSIAAVFLAAVLLNLWIPRFYCRFICPLGALFGLLTRWTPFRVGKRQGQCNECELCENHCQGACDPFGKIRLNECLLCMNCLRACRQARMGYGPERSVAGEIDSPGLSRRGFLATAVCGVVAAPALRLGGLIGPNWNSNVVRPPGALAEEDFLNRCIKCGQCMRVCPTNVIQPAGVQTGLEGLWTPLLNFRSGTSGCQLNCIACGQLCPTAAIRPLTLDEKLGRGDFQATGPVRIGTAFVDRGRCLPWAMDVPCIVCQENCPVSPKAIFVREEFQPIRDSARLVKSATNTTLTLEGAPWRAGKLASGDYFVRVSSASTEERRLIADNSGGDVVLAPSAALPEPLPAGARVVIEVRLQRPVVDPERCIGCGVCQHECPVSGLRAIRVTAENESRTKRHSLLTRA